MVDKALAYRTSYSYHCKNSQGKCYECYHCSKFYFQKERFYRHVKNCSGISGITYLFDKENLIHFKHQYQNISKSSSDVLGFICKRLFLKLIYLKVSALQSKLLTKMFIDQLELMFIFITLLEKEKYMVLLMFFASQK